MPTHPQVNVSISGVLNQAIDRAKNSFFDSLGMRDFQPHPVILGLYETVQSDGADQTYAQPESVPRWRHWPRDAARTRQAFGEVFQTVTNLDWEDSIQMHMNDLQDDKTGDMVRRRAMEASQRFLQLKERIALQILQNSTDFELLPSVPLDYNGLNVISASHSFATGGNVVTGSGVAAAELITDDLYSVLERASSAVDTVSGEPYFPNGVTFEQMRIIASGVANRKVWGEALRAVILPGGLSATSTISNVLVDEAAGLKDRVYFSPRLTGNDYYIYFEVPGRPKPLLWQERQPVNMVETNMQNSDIARERKIITFDWDARFTAGIVESRLVYQVNN